MPFVDFIRAAGIRYHRKRRRYLRIRTKNTSQVSRNLSEGTIVMRLPPPSTETGPITKGNSKVSTENIALAQEFCVAVGPWRGINNITAAIQR